MRVFFFVEVSPFRDAAHIGACTQLESPHAFLRGGLGGSVKAEGHSTVEGMGAYQQFCAYLKGH